MMVAYGCKRDRGNGANHLEGVGGECHVQGDGRPWPRANVSINGICISFPLWGYIITIG